MHIMHGMNSESVDLIVLDPPFNSKRFYSAPIGSKAAGASFKDMWTWKDVDESYLELLVSEYPYMVQFIQSVGFIHSNPMKAYLTYMAQRIMEMHRILKSTGSLYLHCDPTASHYLKIICDRIFGKDNLRNEIVWFYKTGGMSKRWFGRKHDIIFFYSKTGRYRFNPLKEKSYLSHKYGFKNIEIHQDSGGYYRMVGMRDVWDIPALRGNQPETIGYPTQKPVALLERMVRASSDPGDLVMDPFCGCATTCVAAQNLQRRWIGIDIEAKSAELVARRLEDEHGLFTDFVHTTQFPVRTDIEIVKDGRDVRQRLYDEQKGQCNGCQTHFDHVRHFHLDHIVPRSKNGADCYENYQLLCGSCNSIKGDRPMAYLTNKIAKLNEAMKFRVSFDADTS